MIISSVAEPRVYTGYIIPSGSYTDSGTVYRGYHGVIGIGSRTQAPTRGIYLPGYKDVNDNPIIPPESSTSVSVLCSLETSQSVYYIDIRLGPEPTTYGYSSLSPIRLAVEGKVYTATYQGSNGNYRTETTPTVHFLTNGVPVPFTIWAGA